METLALPIVQGNVKTGGLSKRGRGGKHLPQKMKMEILLQVQLANLVTKLTPFK